MGMAWFSITVQVSSTCAALSAFLLVKTRLQTDVLYVSGVLNFAYSLTFN